MDVKVTGFSTNEKELKNGNLRLGFFDCELPGVRLFGCTLVRTRQGGFMIMPPLLEGPQGGRRAVHLTDNTMRTAMMEAARRTYVALGGEHGEYAPKKELENANA